MTMKSLSLYLALFCVVVFGALACDKQLCASSVSRCQLLKSCECDMSDKRNCSCCHNCQLCLAELYIECCSCVGMCPLPNPEDSMHKSSAIEVLEDPIPDLFSVLTEEEDYLKRWTTYRYPVFFDSMYSKETNMEPGLDQTKDPASQFESRRNCTVAFMSECIPMGLCKKSCQSMGAAKYRWFHDKGCCQCIGKPCQDFGLNEAKCLKCQSEEENDNHTPGEDDDAHGVPPEVEEHLRHGHHPNHNKHNQRTEKNKLGVFD